MLGVRDLVAVVDEARDVLLVLEAGLERREIGVEGLVRLGDGLHRGTEVVVEQIAADGQRVVHLLLRLDLVPVGEPLEAAVLVVVGKGEVEVAGIELLVDLLVQDGGDLARECHGKLPSRTLRLYALHSTPSTGQRFTRGQQASIDARSALREERPSGSPAPNARSWRPKRSFGAGFGPGRENDRAQGTLWDHKACLGRGPADTAMHGRSDWWYSHLCWRIAPPCPSGGIGRRDGLKNR